MPKPGNINFDTEQSTLWRRIYRLVCNLLEERPRRWPLLSRMIRKFDAVPAGRPELYHDFIWKELLNWKCSLQSSGCNIILGFGLSFTWLCLRLTGEDALLQSCRGYIFHISYKYKQDYSLFRFTLELQTMFSSVISRLYLVIIFGRTKSEITSAHHRPRLTLHLLCQKHSGPLLFGGGWYRSIPHCLALGW